jgi:hypothetical protein
MRGTKSWTLGCTGNEGVGVLMCLSLVWMLCSYVSHTHRYWTWDWRDGYIPLAGVDAGNHALLVNNTYSENLAKANLGARWYATNLLSELDNEGEYYVSRSGKSKGMLYFKPKSGRDSLTAVFVSAASQVYIALTHTRCNANTYAHTHTHTHTHKHTHTHTHTHTHVHAHA